MVLSLRSVRVLALCCSVAALATSCSRSTDSQVQSADSLLPAPTTTVAPTTIAPTTIAATTTLQPAPSTTAPSDVAAPTTTPAEVVAAPPTAAPTQPANAATIQVQGIAVPTLGAGTTPYAVPTPQSADFGDGHDYPAVDIFVGGGCGGDVTAPANGTVVEVRREDNYDKAVDNPATRGGKSVTMVGDDGVRYYMSHFDSISPDIEPGTRVEVGEQLGIVGTTGRSGGCHIHFGISPVCQNKEWSIRRGVIGPMPFLQSWRDGGQASPVEAVQQYLAENPDACAAAEADPNAGDG